MGLITVYVAVSLCVLNKIMYVVTSLAHSEQAKKGWLLFAEHLLCDYTILSSLCVCVQCGFQGNMCVCVYVGWGGGSTHIPLIFTRIL